MLSITSSQKQVPAPASPSLATLVPGGPVRGGVNGLLIGKGRGSGSLTPT
jgi:hypothetical protein